MEVEPSQGLVIMFSRGWRFSRINEMSTANGFSSEVPPVINGQAQLLCFRRSLAALVVCLAQSCRHSALSHRILLLTQAGAGGGRGGHEGAAAARRATGCSRRGRGRADADGPGGPQRAQRRADVSLCPLCWLRDHCITMTGPCCTGTRSNRMYARVNVDKWVHRQGVLRKVALMNTTF